jgi:hypothetical protein
MENSLEDSRSFIKPVKPTPKDPSWVVPVTENTEIEGYA